MRRARRRRWWQWQWQWQRWWWEGGRAETRAGVSEIRSVRCAHKMMIQKRQRRGNRVQMGWAFKRRLNQLHRLYRLMACQSLCRSEGWLPHIKLGEKQTSERFLSLAGRRRHDMTRLAHHWVLRQKLAGKHCICKKTNHLMLQRKSCLSKIIK